jgi:two-component system sensor histidine kinase AlgZ
MHPILTQPKLLLAYVSAWTGYGLLLAGVTAFGMQAPLLWSLYFWVPSCWLLGFMCLSYWYIVNALPARETPWSKLIGTWLGIAIVLTSIWLAAILQWESFLLPTEQEGAVVGTAPTYALAGAIAIAISVLSHYLVAAFDRSRRAETRSLELQVHAREAELKSLRSQLDPHFLFNSLNSVAALIGSDATSARRMCLLLAAFCRKSISLGREPAIRFTQELELTETFLAIEAVRFSERLRIRFDIAADTRDLSVPPLMLQPLVENAIHHGIAHLLDGGEVSISARLREHSVAEQLLELVVENPFDPEAPKSRGAGVGINNVRARIDTLYGHRASIEVENMNQHFRVTLLMPATPMPQSEPAAAITH